MILDQFRLDGKTALVTGCRRGIGRALAVALAEAGADIVGVSASLGDEDAVACDVRDLGRRFQGAACDFSCRESLSAWLRQLLATGPPIDILINNAGVILRKPAAEHPDEDWDRVLEVNLTAQFIVAREIGRDMLARGHGKIVFIASLLTFQGGITVPSYAASKGGVGQLTMALANEWAGRGVNVNAIAPGYIETDNTQALRDNPARSAAILQRIPAGRWGRTADLQGAAVFLSSPAADYVHGTILTVDGGWLGR